MIQNPAKCQSAADRKVLLRLQQGTLTEDTVVGGMNCEHFLTGFGKPGKKKGESFEKHCPENFSKGTFMQPHSDGRAICQPWENFVAASNGLTVGKCHIHGMGRDSGAARRVCNTFFLRDFHSQYPEACPPGKCVSGLQTKVTRTTAFFVLASKA